jgi:hypothetical protein
MNKTQMIKVEKEMSVNHTFASSLSHFHIGELWFFLTYALLY